MQTFTTPIEIHGAMMPVVLASCVHALRARASTDGDVLRPRGLITDKRLGLHDLRDIEGDGVNSCCLSFGGGKHVEILKTVEGAAELRQMLATRLEQNRDARTPRS